HPSTDPSPSFTHPPPLFPSLLLHFLLSRFSLTLPPSLDTTVDRVKNYERHCGIQHLCDNRNTISSRPRLSKYTPDGTSPLSLQSKGYDIANTTFALRHSFSVPEYRPTRRIQKLEKLRLGSCIPSRLVPPRAASGPVSTHHFLPPAYRAGDH
ncbi:hypothetical protein CTA1_5093, partial [Colletotrichum tanaceti]